MDRDRSAGRNDALRCPRDLSFLLQNRLRGLTFALGAAIACSPSIAVPLPAPQGRAAATPAFAGTPAPTATRAPSLADVLSGVAPALRSALGPAGIEKLEVAASVCAAAVRGKGDKARVGCRSCPPFDGTQGSTRHVAILDEPGASGVATSDFFELELVLSGSFSRAGAKEAAAVFDGCEPHSENWGGTLLVEWKGSAWAPVSYRSGFHPAECVVVPASGLHDVLVCSWGSTHQGHTVWLLDVYDFTRGDSAQPERGWDRLLTLRDDALASCWDDGDPTISVGSIDRLSVSAPGASPTRVLVDVSFGSERKTTNVKAECRAALEQGDQSVRVGGAITRTKTRLEFERHGNHIVPSAASKVFIERASSPP
jgi:hypothetical protein